MVSGIVASGFSRKIEAAIANHVLHATTIVVHFFGMEVTWK